MGSDLIKSVIESFEKNSKKRFITFKKDFVYDRYTYGEIYEYSLKFITLLKENKLKKGDKVAICGYNSPEWVYSFLGGVFSGLVLVPIDFASSPELINKFIEKTESKLLITSKYKITNSKIKKIYFEELKEDLLKKKKGSVNTNIENSDILEILFTSGTTGEPKGVILTHENIYSNIVSTKKRIRIDDRDKLISLIPLSHMLEQIAGFFAILVSGAQIVQLKSRRTSEILKVFKKEKITTLATVPAFLNLFKSKLEDRAKEQGKYHSFSKSLKIASKLPFPLRRILFKKIHKAIGGKLTRMVSGGAPLSLETEIFWDSLGVAITQGYGLTETSPVLTLSNEYDKRFSSVGRAIPGVRLKLGKNNEILAKGRNVTLGYYKNEKATKELFEEGWLKTGDIGEFDKDNYLYIKGRLKNMILKPSGFNVYPEDIEAVLNKKDNIKDSCVLGITSGNDVIITAVLLLKNQTSNKEVKKIIEDSNKQLEQHQKIQNHLVWKKQDFPRTLTLKVKRNLVQEDIEKKTQISTESRDLLIHTLSELSHINAKEINEKSNLYSDLGFDSLKIIELATKIEEKIGVDIEEYLIDSKTTVTSLRELIAKGKQPSNSLVLDKSMFSPLLYPLKIIFSEVSYLFSSIFFTKIIIKGKENLRKLKENQAIYILTNHTSHLDVLVLFKQIPLNKRIKISFGAAADYFFKKSKLKDKLISKFFYYVLGGFPMSRDKDIENRTSIRQSFEFIGEILDRGWSIGLSPEGTRSRSGDPAPYKNGIGLIVKEAQLPVIPFKLKGLYEIMPPHSKFPKKRGPVEVIIGKPIYVPSNLSPLEITQFLEKQSRAI